MASVLFGSERLQTEFVPVRSVAIAARIAVLITAFWRCCAYEVFEPQVSP